MNKLIFEPQEYARLYNCNHFHIEEVAIEKRQHFYKPVLLITLATIYNILYVPCKLSIHKHRANSCYKILLFMSIANVCNVCLLGYVNGYLSLVGAVFCSSPTFSYVVGCVALSLWAIETVAEIILSLNRCLVMMSARLEAKLFNGWLTYIWISVAFGYFLFYLLFVKPALFSSIDFISVFNPYAGYVEDIDENYTNLVDNVSSTVAAITIPAIYCIFFISYTFQKNIVNKGSVTKIKSSHKMMTVLLLLEMFFQIMIISFVNFVSGAVFTLMYYYDVDETIVHFGYFCWFHIHGLPPVIFWLSTKQSGTTASI